MIARVKIGLPFFFIRPIKEALEPIERELGGYRVAIRPPQQLFDPLATHKPPRMLVDGSAVFSTNLLVLDFKAPTFNRAERGPMDPPIELIEFLANDTLNKLRWVASTAAIDEVDFPGTPITISYYDDNGALVPVTPGLVRGHRAGTARSGANVINGKFWNRLRALPPETNPPAWAVLLQDAQVSAHRGTALVLASTALEVFFGWLATRLKREDVRKQYARSGGRLHTKFSEGLIALAGCSLKADAGLWLALEQLRSARNEFAHEGVLPQGPFALAVPGLVAKAVEITHWVRNRVPTEIQWSVYDNQVSLDTQLQVAHISRDEVLADKEPPEVYIKVGDWRPT